MFFESGIGEHMINRNYMHTHTHPWTHALTLTSAGQKYWLKRLLPVPRINTLNTLTSAWQTPLKSAILALLSLHAHYLRMFVPYCHFAARLITWVLKWFSGYIRFLLRFWVLYLALSLLLLGHIYITYTISYNRYPKRVLLVLHTPSHTS